MEIFVHHADSEQPELVEVETTALVRTLLIDADADADGHVWIEDTDEEVDLDVTFEAAGIGRHQHLHRGRCRHVEVLARFNGLDFEHHFVPAARIKRVQRWAFGPKGAALSPEQAAEHVLAQPGADHALDGTVHLGSLVTDDSCRVTLDVVPRARFAG
jgi:hypothetical protein